ncbi:MAG: TIGR03936 family radical SAM-associated protein [Candidatus Omnitrophica bacterium]|nr:TIGR03936 family radical SAM-associated protein [Candidatus Omnitrophota bacterium]MBU2044431.1 TIGR03936 family radical SAM-associated protein [Candidatus Omnitrophota bacterium]MBU2250992.1 TIGR03936 family radical SAM-associated protein [Candidatus Omnitrophota bacterium]MBU2265672.1 TIGR03936 family radical SAM-associated protein [Candidatus Omnitrophota bacterium]MBU2473729.1 TIGR03936 family radical SAM-associated protein [Candidatus Omnitrophota bacterium]
MQTIKFPIAVILHKHGEMVYFSQLDLIHILERALRRSDLPLYFTQGFNPHVKISFKNGLKLGQEGFIEVIFYFTENIVFCRLKEILQPQLPEGLEIIDKEVSG